MAYHTKPMPAQAYLSAPFLALNYLVERFVTSPAALMDSQQFTALHHLSQGTTGAVAVVVLDIRNLKGKSTTSRPANGFPDGSVNAICLPLSHGFTKSIFSP